MASDSPTIQRSHCAIKLASSGRAAASVSCWKKHTVTAINLHVKVRASLITLMADQPPIFHLLLEISRVISKSRVIKGLRELPTVSMIDHDIKPHSYCRHACQQTSILCKGDVHSRLVRPTCWLAQSSSALFLLQEFEFEEIVYSNIQRKHALHSSYFSIHYAAVC